MLLPGLDSNAPYLMTTSSCGQMLTMSLLYSIDFVSFQRKTFFFLKIWFDQHTFVKLYVFSSFVKICINAFLCFECLVIIFQPLFFSLKVFQTLVLAFSMVWIWKVFSKSGRDLIPWFFLRVSENLVEMIRSFGTYPQEIIGTCLPLASYLLPGMRQVFSYYTYMVCHHMPS